ncbi:MAG: DUF58 domain-containing protein [Hespellia sp.]|nr:DUF58 domain-containing protein [Hespellia sp.]
MVKYRAVHATVILFSVASFIYTGEPFYVVLFLSFLLAPLLLKIQLLFEKRKTKIKVTFEEKWMCGVEGSLHIQCRKSGFGIIGLVKVTILLENLLTEEKKQLGITCRGDGTDFMAEEHFVFTRCGRVNVKIERIVLVDCMGLTSMAKVMDKKRPDMEKYILVYPNEEAASSDMAAYAALSARTLCGSYQNDAAFYDLKMYHPGMPVQKIHWKLYGKLGELMVKEMEWEKEEQIMLLLEPAYLPDEMVDTAIGLLFAVSFCLAADGIFHQVCLPQVDGNFTYLVDCENSYMEMQELVLMSLTRWSKLESTQWQKLRTEFGEENIYKIQDIIQEDL